VPIKGTARLLEILDDLRATGYDGFETHYTSLQDEFGDPARLRAEFEKKGVALIGLHVGASLLRPGTIEAERTLIERVARAVKGFGGTHVMVSTGAIPRTAEGKLDAAVLKFKAAELDRAANLCRDLGVTLASHNHARSADNNAEELEAVLAATSRVSLLFDIGHAYLAKADIAAFIRRNSKRIAGFHVRDYKGTDEVPMGEGELDLKGFAAAVAETRWRGWVILEMEQVQGQNSRGLLQGARGYMKSRLSI
jgi:inosose dehydratase